MGQVKTTRIKLPGIGMRIVKSAIAVLLCYVVNYFRSGMGMVFYSQLAALWCIQMYQRNTFQNAVQRTIGTLIGAIYGLLFLLLFASSFHSNTDVTYGLLVSAMIVLVLYTTVLLKKRNAAYFSCVVFLSIVVNHIGDLNPYLFVLNRFLDTMIGILIGVVVNDIRLCFHPNRDTLFVSGLDDVLLNQQEVLSEFSKVELNRMIDDGMKFTISTIRTPASLIEPMKDVRLALPVIAMDGAVLYDINKHEYIRVYVISPETSTEIMRRIEQYNLCWYANVIVDDMLVIYYAKNDDKVNTELVEKLRVSPFRNYVNRNLPENEEVTYFMLLDQEDKIKRFYDSLMEDGFGEHLRIVTYKSHDYKGYAYIKIYNKNATKDNMILYLKQFTGLDKVVTFGTIEGAYDICIQTDSANKVVREVRKQYEPLFK